MLLLPRILLSQSMTLQFWEVIQQLFYHNYVLGFLVGIWNTLVNKWKIIWTEEWIKQVFIV